MYWTIRLTEYHKNKEKVMELVNEYWAEWYIIVLETSKKDKEHYHILIDDLTGVGREAMRKRLNKHGFSGNRQYNLKMLDSQRVFSEFVPYICKDITKKDKGIKYFTSGYKLKLKSMKKIYEKTAQEYKNGVLCKIQAFINSKHCIKDEEDEDIKYMVPDFMNFIVQYYMYAGLCVPSQWRCQSLADTLWLNAVKDKKRLERIKDLTWAWYDGKREQCQNCCRKRLEEEFD